MPVMTAIAIESAVSPVLVKLAPATEAKASASVPAAASAVTPQRRRLMAWARTPSAPIASSRPTTA